MHALNHLKYMSTFKVALIAIALLAVVMLGVFGFYRFTNVTEVHNLSGQTLTGVVLQLHDDKTDWTVTKRVGNLKPGEILRIRHTHNDTKAVVGFDLAGQRFRHVEPYIDLWTGEVWRFDIQADGVVTSGHDLGRRN
jgi:hypothetical protein